MFILLLELFFSLPMWGNDQRARRSAVYHGPEPSQIKRKTMKLMLAASPLTRIIQELEQRLVSSESE